MTSILLALGLVAMVVPLLPATDWHVDTSATCALGTGSSSAPFCTIQNALDVAADGDQILIAPGTYAEDLVFTQSLTFIGTAGFEATTLTPQSPFGPVMQPGHGTTTVLRGLTIEGAEFSGIYLPSRTLARLELWNCRVWKNQTTLMGGGMYLANTDALLVDTLVVQNVADPLPTSTRPNAYGAGIYHFGGSLTLDRCVVADNHNLGRDYADAGGIATGASDVLIRDSLIEGNFVGALNGGSKGGGIHMGLGTLRIERSTISRNFSHFGGGVYSSAPTTLENVQFVQNRARRGAALDIARDATTLRNVTIAGRSPVSLVHLGLGTSVAVENSILWQNSGGAPSIGGDAAGVSASSVSHSNIFGGWTGAGGGNIDLPPAFRDSESGDYRLLPSSPCIDAGDATFSSAGKDVSGAGRLMDGNLDGSLVVDMGAHEYSNLSLAVSGQLVPGASLTVEVSGNSSVLSTFLAISPAPSSGLLFSRFGSLFFDPAVHFVTLALGPPPASTVLVVPPSDLSQARVVFQAIGFAAPVSGQAPGNLSNAVTKTAP